MKGQNGTNSMGKVTWKECKGPVFCYRLQVQRGLRRRTGRQTATSASKCCSVDDNSDISSVCQQAVTRCDSRPVAPLSRFIYIQAVFTLKTAGEIRCRGKPLECAPRTAGSVSKRDTYDVPLHDPLIPINVLLLLCLLASLSFICTL